MEDTTAPTFDVDPLPEVTVEATGAQTDVRGSLTAPAVSDLVDPSPVVTNNTQASYPLGNHTITWTATDNDGLFATLDQNVIVAAAILPTFADPSLPDVRVEATGELTDITSDLTVPAATNSTGGAIIPTNNVDPLGYALGTHVIT